jgi:hypothetical protein
MPCFQEVTIPISFADKENDNFQNKFEYLALNCAWNIPNMTMLPDVNYLAWCVKIKHLS